MAVEASSLPGRSERQGLGGPGGAGRGGRSLPPVLRPLRRVPGALLASAAFVPLMALLAMVAVLLVEAWPAVRFNGAGFFTSGVWSIGSLYSTPVTTGGVLHLAGAQYGALDLVIGTLECSAIALLIGFPIAFGAAVMIAERLHRRLSAVLGLCLEVLAGIPSVVFGLWGILVLGPVLKTDVYPVLARLPNVPVLNIFRGAVGNGEGLLSAGIVLAIMIIPIIAATTRDLLRQVPVAPKEGAEALGMTRREAFKTVQSRWVRSGVIGSAVLGLGRALGETIAVALVSGSQIHSPSNIYDTMTTIAATIVNQLDAALTDPTHLAVRSLAEGALVLLVITLIVNVAARTLVRRSARDAALPVGAGL
jgi:phosphate transport system permease protein